MRTSVLVLLLVCLWNSLANLLAAPFHVFLTWQDDPSTSMTVNYHTRKGEGGPISQVHFDTESREGQPEFYGRIARGRPHQIPGLADERQVHAVELANLRPNTTYYFVAGDPEHGFSKEFKFRTLPDGREPIRFVTGGDMGVNELANRLLKMAARENPHFALIGGDIAYVNGDLLHYATWDGWLDAWQNYMVTDDGHLIPIIAAIGNHECNSSTGDAKVRAPFYYGYFAQGGRSHFSRRIGSRAILYTLDSGHTQPHAGAQTDWLAAEMAKHWRVPFQFAVYHVPLYPSHRSYDGELSKLGREHWGPVFDRYGLTAAFENHDHTFKRSKRLKSSQPHPEGTLYLGDGCFGRSARTVDSEVRWYLEKQSGTPHFWRVDISEGAVVYQAIDEEGRVFDVALSNDEK